jgi:hypothetical protein
LEADRTPSQAQWDSLFSAPGYAEFEAYEQQRDRRQGLITLAFKPTVPAGLERNTIRSEGELQTLEHLRFAAAHRNQIDEFSSQFANESTIAKAVAAAQEYLPPGAADLVLVPPIKLIVLYPGGRALPSCVVFDASLFYGSTAPHRLLGHELHHVFRRKLERVRESEIGRADMPLMSLLIRMELDGVADLIDKRSFVTSEDAVPITQPQHPSVQRVRSQCDVVFRQAGELLRRLNAAMIDISGSPADSARISEEFKRSLPWMGQQTVGMFMATTIEQQFGREQLIATVGDPFAFVQAYSKAAAKANTPDAVPVLAPESLGLLAELARKYRLN